MCMEKYKEIERSIIKKYRKEIFSKATKAVKDYNLIQEKDNVMVCISGGKDSFLLAKCIQELERHGKVKFSAHYVVMNPGYNEKNLKMIEDNAKLLNIPIEIFTSDIFEVANKLNKAKKDGRRIIAVGTTSTRTLETIMQKYGTFKSCTGWTNIFIYPGYTFQAIDGLITNFHLPKSTLIMLVSALAGKDFILNSYKEAVDKKYRFFSFGDCMFIE